MNVKKIISYTINIAVIAFIIIFLEGGLQTWGIIGFILFNIVLVAWKMWKGKEALQIIKFMSQELADKHKETAKHNKEYRKQRRKKKNAEREKGRKKNNN